MENNMVKQEPNQKNVLDMLKVKHICLIDLILIRKDFELILNENYHIRKYRKLITHNGIPVIIEIAIAFKKTSDNNMPTKDNDYKPYTIHIAIINGKELINSIAIEYYNEKITQIQTLLITDLNNYIEYLGI